MADPNTIDFWEKGLGLLPVPLHEGSDELHDHVMLNGGQGNFCLRLPPVDVDDSPDLRSLAWSADVGHFVVAADREIRVVRWSDPLDRSESFSARSVADRIDEFHQFLEQKDPPRTKSIVRHVASIFSGLWNALRTEDGEDALRAFLCLLASANDRVEIQHLHLKEWNISQKCVDIAHLVRTEDWHELQRLLLQGPPQLDLKAHIDLLLRHASGPLFQQAHHLAHVSPQTHLAGIIDMRMRQVRKREGDSGVFFTPPALARTIVEVAIDSLDLSSKARLVVFDPACGSSEFLREFLRIARLKGFRGEIHLIGWDISAIAIELSQFVLRREEVSTAGLGKTTVDLKQADSLAGGQWPREVDLVLTNPPFLSWDLMLPEQRDQLSQVLGPLSKKKPNMASAFLLLAKQALAQDGILGAVVPSSFISGQSAAPLRDDLAASLHPILLAKLGSQIVFKGALVDAGLYIATRRDRIESPIALWADYRQTSIGAALRGLRRLSIRTATYTPVSEPNYSIYPAPQLGNVGGSWAPTSFEAYSLLERLKALPSVSSLFDVKQGVRMGNDLYVVTATYYGVLPEPEKIYFRPAVMNSSIRGGRLEASSYIFYPNSEGLEEITSEESLEAVVPIFYRDRLRPAKEALSNRARVAERRWWKLMEHRAWLESPMPKIVSTYFGDAGSFAFDSKGDFVPVVGNGWIWKKASTKTPRLRRKDLTLTNAGWHAYLAILTSRFFSTLISGVSQHVGGGQWDLSKRFVGNARIPDLTLDGVDQAVFSRLAEFGARIAHGREFDRDALEETVRVVYGVG